MSNVINSEDAAAALIQWDRVYALSTVIEEGLRQRDDSAGGGRTKERCLAEVALQELEILRNKVVALAG